MWGIEHKEGTRSALARLTIRSFKKLEHLFQMLDGIFEFIAGHNVKALTPVFEPCPYRV
jgi:hypothetical protein